MSEKTPKKTGAQRPDGARTSARPERAKPARDAGRNPGRKGRPSQWEGARESISKGRFGLMALIGVGVIALMFVSQMGMGGSQTAESPLQISEVMTSNATAHVLSDGSVPDWIEIENISEKPVNLSGYGLMLEADPTDIYTFSAQVLEPGEYTVVCADGNTAAGSDHAPFRLSASGGNIALFDKRGSGVDLAEVPELETDQSYARDVAGNWQITDTPTPGEVNNITKPEETAAGETVIRVQPGALEISEIMSGSVTWYPDENGEYHDYIEIRNTSASAVNLGGWSLTDREDKLTRWQFPDVTIPAGGYLAVYCTGLDGISSDGSLQAGAPSCRDAG